MASRKGGRKSAAKRKAPSGKREAASTAKRKVASTAKRKATATKKPARRKAGRRKAASGPQVLVVNMMPKALSREHNQDSEPTIAVNPANPLEIVGTSFTPDPMGGALAPLYVSRDGGNTWSLNSIVPSHAKSTSGTFDISVAFGSAGGRLYGGILRDSSENFETLRSADPTAATAMQVLQSRPDNDQPFTHAITKAGKDSVYIGNNDFQAQPKTATVDVYADAAKGTPTPKKVRIEVRNTAGQDGPQVRPVAHADGTAYAAFYGWRSQTGSFPGNTLVVTSDIVVVRDDHGGSGALAFHDLKDPGDGLAGRLVAHGVKIPFSSSGTAVTGQQRLGGTLAIAVDPRAGHSGVVWLAWADQQPRSMMTIHVRRSDDRGATWSAADLLTVPNAINAALAVNNAGVVGLLYQQLLGSGATARWSTHFRSSANGASWSDVVLANTSATSPTKLFDPYLGDYDHLVAVGADFYGIFSASNQPAAANFPSGVKYQRNADFKNGRLLALDNTTPVAVSIDPFFFKVTGIS